MIKFISDYFRKTESYSTGRFIFEMFLLTSIPKILVILVGSVFIFFLNEELIFFEERSEGESLVYGLNWVAGFILLCVLAPIFETLFAQAVPVYITSFITKSRIVHMLTSSIFFCFLHSSQPYFYLFIIFITGCIYAWSFIVYKTQGFFKAFLVTSIIHSLFNFIAFLAIYLF